MDNYLIEQLKKHLAETPIEQQEKEWNEICKDIPVDVGEGMEMAMNKTKIVERRCSLCPYNNTDECPSATGCGQLMIYMDGYEDALKDNYITI